MEPNKLETQIKEQLNAREIQPSEMAWDRLDAMLSVAEEKKNKTFFFSFLSIYWNCCQRFGIGVAWFVFLQSKRNRC